MDLFFQNPWAMVAGGLLISSPIIIHLINRMRFKRIRWAAMEFLLKSQKRNRRRLIIEQLILLLLRILIVLLLGFLLARLVWGASNAGQSAMHVVVLDDSLSMSDRWNENGEPTNSFDQGKRLIKEIAKFSQQAAGAQTMKVYLLSQLEEARRDGKIDVEPIFNQQLGDTSMEDLGKALDDVNVKPTALHLDPIVAMGKAEELFENAHQNKRTLLLVSDFRDNDWVVGPEAKALNAAVDHLVETGANWMLVDTGNPLRGANHLAQNHDNLAIVEFKAESKVVAEEVPVQFTVVLHNYSPAEKNTFLHFKINGVEDFEGSQPVKVPAGQPATVKFTKSLAKAVRENDLGPPRDNDPPDVREQKRLADRQFFRLSVEINSEDTGLQGDNVRDLVVEVRRKVPALVIDGNSAEGIGPGGDLFHIEVAFTAARSFDAERRKLDDLAKINLDLYPTIYLLNVSDIKDPIALQKLDDYVKKGGSLVYFLGDKVNSTFYNTTLHKQLGLFPVLLQAKPTEFLTEEERVARRREDQPKMLFPNKKDEIVETIAAAEPVFRFVLIDRYWPTAPRFQWTTTPTEPVEELIDLPNRKDAHDYAAPAQALMKSAIDAATALADKDKNFVNYPPVLTEYQAQMRKAFNDDHLYEVSLVFDRMLNDAGAADPKDASKMDPKKPKMATLWGHDSMKTLKMQIETFITTIRYGDPLVVSRKHGKGRVVACLTPAGTLTKWNDWGGGSIASATFPMFIMDMQRVLTKQGDDLNHLVGEKLHFVMDPAKYKATVDLVKLPQPELTAKSKAVGDNPVESRPAEQKFSAAMQTKDLGLELDFNKTRDGGFYTLIFTRQDGTKESQTYAFNVDSAAESDLRRADREKLEHNVAAGGFGSKRGVIRMIEAGNDLTGFKVRIPDFSEKPWLFLLLLIILIAEQAMAVHLSFHMKGGEGASAPAAPGAGATAKASAAA